MRFFVSSLHIFYLLCLSLPSIALEKNAADIDLQVDHAVAVGSGAANATTAAGPWASALSPSLHLRFTSAVQAFTVPQPGLYLRLSSAAQAFATPEPPPSDFWEKVKDFEQTLLDYVPRLLQSADAYFKSTAFTDITRAMKDVVHTTATFRENIQDALDTHHITLDTLTGELEVIFLEVVHNLENIPPPSETPGHSKRNEAVNKVLDDTELALVNLLTRYGIGAEAVTAYLDALKPHVCALTVAVGDINEQYPQLLPALTFSVAIMLIPEAWILRPFLSIFGFGPAGPVKGSAAAWMQRFFWGAAVKSGSWFAWLQAAGMGVIPKWAGLISKAPFFIGALLAMLIPCIRRR